MTYNELYVGMSRYFSPKQLAWVLASHADPDIIASLNRWLSASDTKLVISRIWSRFVPHFCTTQSTHNRIVEVPDEGGAIKVGRYPLIMVPAHFLHSEGNFQFYDPVSRILFSGDLGASLTHGDEARQPVRELAPHIPRMLGFHQRYMISNKVCRLWANMVRGLEIDLIAPQHGAPIVGRQAVSDFIDWVEQLQCGVDLLTADQYRLPDPRKVTRVLA